MPGVLVVEAMAQAGGIIIMHETPDREKKLVVFTGIERAKFTPSRYARGPAPYRGERRLLSSLAPARSRAAPMLTASSPARPR